MTDHPNPQDNQPEPGTQSSAETQNTEHMIPKSRFDEINNRYKAVMQQLADLEAKQQEQDAAQRQQRDAELAEQNRYKELYEQALTDLEALKPVQAQAEQYQASLQATNEARIAQIPEERRHLVPDFDDPVKLGAYLDKALPDLIGSGKPPAPKLDGGSGSTGQAPERPLGAEHQALADLARQMGYNVTNERIAGYARNPAELSENKGDES